MMENMDKRKVSLIIGIFFLFLTTIILLILTIGGNDGNGIDYLGIPFGSFFVIFILPRIIAHQKNQREEKKIKLTVK